MNGCCFSGHRIRKLNLTEEQIIKLKQRLNEIITGLCDEGVKEFFSGMAEGVDLMAAAEVIKIKKQRDIRLLGVVPFDGQEKAWSLAERAEYLRILDACDDVHILSPEYYKGCYFVRNQYMVDKCNTLLAVFNGSEGGTKFTMDYAVKKHKQVIVLNPETLEASILPVQLGLDI